jgi:hypothetical protein
MLAGGSNVLELILALQDLHCIRIAHDVHASHVAADLAADGAGT